MNEYIIKSENTAIKLGYSTSAKLLIQDASADDICLDFGCGLLRNAEQIKTHVKQLDLYDSKLQMDKHTGKLDEYGDIYYIEDNDLPIDKYNKVLCSYVLNVIQDINIRKQAAVTAINALKKHGLCYIEVRDEESFRGLKNYVKDEVNGGIIIGKGKTRTYQMAYTYDELEKFINSLELTIRITRKVVKSGSIIIVVEKL